MKPNKVEPQRLQTKQPSLSKLQDYFVSIMCCIKPNEPPKTPQQAIQPTEPDILQIEPDGVKQQVT